MNEWESIKQCLRSDNCNAPICPLDPKIDQRDFIYGEKVCPLILDYAAGRVGQFDAQIKATESIWRDKITPSLIKRGIKAREGSGEYFAALRRKLVNITGLMLLLSIFGCGTYSAAVKNSARLVVEDYEKCLATDCTQRDADTNRTRLITAHDLCCLLDLKDCCKVQ